MKRFMDLLRVDEVVSKKENVIRMNPIEIREAVEEDLSAIYNIACSVGYEQKDPNAGFLMDDYTEKPQYYHEFFQEKIQKLDHFYIAESKNVLGFLLAYTKEEWLEENPTWMEEVYWNPEFDRQDIENFIVVDKIAVMAEQTGKGIGSILHKHLIHSIEEEGIEDIFQEVIISPTPNLVSLAFKNKQEFSLAGFRYENYDDKLYTDLVYHKTIYDSKNN